MHGSSLTHLLPGFAFVATKTSTELINLIDARFRDTIDRNSSFRNAFEHLYWQAAGKNHKTGKKSILIQLFEEKYMGDFIDFMEDYNECNLSKKFQQLPDDVQKNPKLIKAMRHYDYTVNVKWVLAHYDAAGKYLGGGDKDIEATGGSNWRKYMHPKYQRRIFFPYLWSEEELKNWGTF